MRKNWRKQIIKAGMGLVLAVLLGAVALVLVGKFAPDQGYVPQNVVDMPSRVVTTVLKPFQSAFSWAVNGVRDYLDTWKLRTNIEIEYNKLKAQNDELVYQSMLNDELEAENERLTALLGVVDDYKEMNPVVAKVTNKESGNWFRTFTIDKGSAHGIETEMAVINSSGLIGYVYEVYDYTSEVISIVDSRCSVAALIQSSRDQGIIKGTLGIEDEGTCRMYYLPVDLVPRPGDTVVTSGVGQPFPKGLPVGVVRESTRYMDENKHYVVIEPYVDFMHIEEVLVLVYRASAEEMPDADDGQLDYVPVAMDTARPVPVIGDEVSDPNLGAVTAPPRQDRGAEPVFTLAPGATPTPNPELDAELEDEMTEDSADELTAPGDTPAPLQTIPPTEDSFFGSEEE